MYDYPDKKFKITVIKMLNEKIAQWGWENYGWMRLSRERKYKKESKLGDI